VQILRALINPNSLIHLKEYATYYDIADKLTPWHDVTHINLILEDDVKLSKLTIGILAFTILPWIMYHGWITLRFSDNNADSHSS